MSKKRERDEHLEQLWYMREEMSDSIDALKNTMNDDFDATVIDELVSDSSVELIEEENTISLTEKGAGHAQQIVP